MNFTEDTLDEFVRISDSFGGPGFPGCGQYWADFSYTPTYQVDQSLDPFSEAYVQEQLNLHKEMSGRSFNQAENELCPFDLKHHIKSINPYDHPDPNVLAMHIGRLTKAFGKSGAPKGAHLLDMGCGWGLSSEIGAYLGYRVSAVDINPHFVTLVNSRAKKSGWPISAVQSEFETYRPQPNTDLVLFYECLHHAVKVWDVIKTMSDSLAPRSGKLLLAGEPINDIWWTNWGLRLDPLSVYCIRKFGWFESGWSQPFLEECFRRANLTINIEYDDHGSTVVGQRLCYAAATAGAYLAAAPSENLMAEGDAALLAGKAALGITFPNGSTRALLNVICYRPQGLRLEASSAGASIYSGMIPAGATDIVIERHSDLMRVEFDCETWVPHQDIANGDTRTLGVHIQSIAFY